MRSLRKNTQKFKYALLGTEIPIYEDYIDDDGNTIKLDTGRTEQGYLTPVEFEASLSTTGGEVEAKEYGLTTADYDAVMSFPNGLIPITETSLIWHTSEVLYKDDENIIVDDTSADYSIKRISKNLNFTRVLLKRRT